LLPGALGSPPGRRHVLQIVLVLAVCALVRISVVHQTEMIARDGVFYVRMARDWSDHGTRWMLDNYSREPGYGVALGAVRGWLVDCGGSEGLGGWELAGQLISVAGTLASIAAVWWLAGVFFNWRAAWAAALLLGIGRNWVAVGSDVLSEGLALALQTWAIVFALLAFRRLQRLGRSALLWSAISGAAIGAACLVARESMLIAALVAALWLAFAVRAGKGASMPVRVWPLSLMCIAAMAAGIALTAGPYFLAVGGLSHQLADSGHAPPALGAAGGLLATVYVLEHGIFYEMFKKLVEAMHGVMAVAVGIWLTVRVAGRAARGKLPESIQPKLHWPGGLLIVGWLALFTPLMVFFGMRYSNVSFRYMMLMAAMLAPLGGAGVIVVGELIAHLAERAGRRLPATVAVGVFAGALAVGTGLHAMRPLHADKGYFRQAGEFLGRAASADETILTDNAWMLHYSDHRGEVVKVHNMWIDPRDLLASLHESKAGLLALSDRHVDGYKKNVPPNPALRRFLDSGVFEEIDSFTQDKPRTPEIVRVYRVDRQKLPTDIPSAPEPPLDGR